MVYTALSLGESESVQDYTCRFELMSRTLAWNCRLKQGDGMLMPANNSETRGKRNISMAFQLCIASLATAAGTNSYLGREAPNYPTGFGLSMVSPEISPSGLR